MSDARSYPDNSQGHLWATMRFLPPAFRAPELPVLSKPRVYLHSGRRRREAATSPQTTKRCHVCPQTADTAPQAERSLSRPSALTLRAPHSSAPQRSPRRARQALGRAPAHLSPRPAAGCRARCLPHRVGRRWQALEGGGVSPPAPPPRAPTLPTAKRRRGKMMQPWGGGGSLTKW